MPASLLDAVRKVDGVAEAGGYVAGPRAHRRQGRQAHRPARPRASGRSAADRRRCRRSPSTPAGPPKGADEVVIDAGTAKTEHFALGDRVKVQASGTGELHARRHRRVRRGRQPGRGDLRRCWTRRPPSGCSTGPASSTSSPSRPPTACRRTSWRTGIAAGAAGRPRSRHRRRGRRAGGQRHQAVLGFFSTFLLVFAAVSLFVGSFIIYNTFSIIVAQRLRELALLRALGASRRQVTRSVLAEGSSSASSPRSRRRLRRPRRRRVAGAPRRRRLRPAVQRRWSSSPARSIVPVVVGVVITTLSSLGPGPQGLEGAAGGGHPGRRRRAPKAGPAPAARQRRAGLALGIAALAGGLSAAAGWPWSASAPSCSTAAWPCSPRWWPARWPA